MQDHTPPADRAKPAHGEGAPVPADRAPARSAAPRFPFRKRLKIALLAWAAVWMVRLLGATLRLDAPQPESIAPLRKGPWRGQGGTTDKGRPVLLALWHGESFPILYAYQNQGAYVFASRSADGEIMARLAKSLGQRAVRGSSSRPEGARALIDLARIMRREAADSVISPDGPRGPRHVVKPGIILLAKLTGAPILPVASAPSHCWEFHSWDRFRLPKPWARVLIRTGSPIEVPPDADDQVIEAKRAQLERELRALQEAVDREATGTNAGSAR